MNCLYITVWCIGMAGILMCEDVVLHFVQHLYFVLMSCRYMVMAGGVEMSRQSPLPLPLTV